MSEIAATAPHAEPERCANCGSVLTGAFCAACGQSAEAVKRPVRELIEHTLESFFDFDSRGARTLGLLLGKPGRLTRLYLDGKRAPFVPPVRLYLLASLLFFLMVWMTGTAIFQFRTVATTGDHGSLRLVFFEPLNPALQPAPGTLSKIVAVNDSGGRPAWLDSVMNEADKALTDPKRLNERLSDLFPKMMFALVPLFGLLLWPLYARLHRFLVEHLIFALHFHSFIFLLATGVIAIRALTAIDFSGWVFFAPAVIYLLVALRQVYGQGWRTAAAKAALLLAAYGLLFVIAMGAIIFAGLNEA